MQINCLLGTGLEDFWAAMQEYQRLENTNGRIVTHRREQAHAWMWERIHAGLKQAFDQHPQVAAQIGSVTQQVLDGQLPASTAARQLLGVFAKAS